MFRLAILYYYNRRRDIYFNNNNNNTNDENNNINNENRQCKLVLNVIHCNIRVGRDTAVLKTV